MDKVYQAMVMMRLNVFIAEAYSQRAQKVQTGSAVMSA
jgi:hypothetical protein